MKGLKEGFTGLRSAGATLSGDLRDSVEQHKIQKIQFAGSTVIFCRDIQSKSGLKSLSIIVPVRNESLLVSQQLASLQIYRAAGHDIIVVDGESSDDTVARVGDLADRVLSCKPGRSRQMNSGASAAKGSILLFLHADTVLPEHADELIFSALQERGSLWGWFDVRLSSKRFPYAVVATLMNLRSRLTSVCTGDQALFVQRELFQRIQGFPAIELMEDVAISKILRRHSRAARPKDLAVASGRRWQEKGLLVTIWLMWKLRLLYFLGVKPSRLAQMYYPRHD